MDENEKHITHFFQLDFSGSRTSNSKRFGKKTFMFFMFSAIDEPTIEKN